MYFVMLFILMFCNNIGASEQKNNTYEHLSQLTENNSLLKQGLKISACIAMGYGIYALGKEGISYINEQNQVYHSAKKKAIKMIRDHEQQSSFNTTINNQSYNVYLVRERFSQTKKGPGITAQVICRSRAKSYFFPLEELRQEIATEKVVLAQKSNRLIETHGLTRVQTSLVVKAHTVSDLDEFKDLIYTVADTLQQQAHSKHQAIITISYGGVDYEAHIVERPDDLYNPNVILTGNGICKVVLLEQVTAEKLFELLGRDLQ